MTLLAIRNRISSNPNVFSIIISLPPKKQPIPTLNSARILPLAEVAEFVQVGLIIEYTDIRYARRRKKFVHQYCSSTLGF
jgi:hypothetical protein